MTITESTPHTGHHVRPDPQCWAEATDYLVELLGSAPDSLCWDSTHHLQGHAHAGRCELVIIAARDQEHHALVLTADDWDAVKRTTGEERRELLMACAIDSHDRLEAVLAAS